MRMRIGWLVIGLAACTGDKEPDTASGTDSSDSSDVDPTDTGGGGGGTTDVTTPQSLTLTVTDLAGAPLEGVTVKFCNSVGCRTEPTGADGVVVYLNAELVPYSLEPVPPAGSGLATPFVPLGFAANENKALTIAMVPLGAATTLGPSEEVAIGKMHVTVSEATIAPPKFGDAATEFAGVELEPTHFPPINLPGTVLGVWYLSPFDYLAPSGLPVRFDNTFGLADGATAHVWVGSYYDFTWLDGGTVTAEGDFLTGGSIPLLSTVVLIQD